MTRKIALSVVCLIAAACSFAQTPTPPAATAQKSDEIMNKVYRLDMLNYLLPLGMSKDQYAKLLPTLEKIRAAVKKVQEDEATALKGIEADVTAALKEADEKGIPPSKEVRGKIGAVLGKLQKTREISIEINVGMMWAALKDIWNAGQKKFAAQALNPRDYNPNAKVEDMKDEDKIMLFIREIMLHPTAYDVMVKLSQKK